MPADPAGVLDDPGAAYADCLDASITDGVAYDCSKASGSSSSSDIEGLLPVISVISIILTLVGLFLFLRMIWQATRAIPGRWCSRHHETCPHPRPHYQHPDTRRLKQV